MDDIWDIGNQVFPSVKKIIAEDKVFCYTG